MNTLPKFRAWDKRGLKMHKVLSIDFLNGKIAIDDNGLGENTPLYCKQEELELMQWSGLVDRGIKEIYVGDILYMKSSVVLDIALPYKPKKKAWGYVGFENGEYVVKNMVGKYEAYSSLANRGTNNPIEVIGNIYEHPHLLKERTNEKVEGNE